MEPTSDLSTRVPFLVGAVVAGVSSWAVVHKRPVRGDQAVLLLALALALQFCIVCSSKTIHTHGALGATILFYATYVTTLLGTTVAYRLSPWHPLATYPGPWIAKVSNLWLTYTSLRGERYLILDELHARYGDFVRIGPNFVSINSSSVIALYSTMEKSETYHRHMRSKGFELFFKPQSTAQHRERKRAWAGLFTSTGLAQLMPNLERRTMELMQCMERRQSESTDGFLDIKELVAHWAYDFTADVIFGGINKFELMKNGDPNGFSTTGKMALAIIDTIGPSRWIMDICWAISAEPEKANNMLTLFSETTRRRLQSVPDFQDLIYYLLRGRISEDDIRNDACVAIVGGSDNIAAVVTLSIYFLLSQPNYYQRLRDELDAAFPDPMSALPDNELTTLPFLNGVINEALRLGTPFFLPRIVPAGGAVIDGNFIPGNTTIALAAYSQQLSPDHFYPDPREFHPDRWIPCGLGPETKTDKSVLASFTFGPYACIGRPLAYREMRHALARAFLTFDMTLPPDFDSRGFREGIRSMHTTFFNHKLLVKVARRPGVKFEYVYM